MSEIDIDNIIIRLTKNRNPKQDRSRPVPLTEAEIGGLCFKSREIFLQQPVLLELVPTS
jgi:serine/threonine-protein phosphatase PP1 catalytic subunit